MRKVVLCMAVMAVLAMTSIAPAATTYTEWRGTAGDGLWTTAANWSAGVPLYTDGSVTPGVAGNPNGKAGFKQAAGATFNSGTMTTDILVVGGGAGNIDLTINGGTLNVSEYITLAAGSTDNGYLKLTGGTINTGVNLDNTRFYVTQLGTGTLEMTGGAITVGLNYPAPAGTFGELWMTGASGAGIGTMIMSGGNIYAANLQKGTGTASLTITSDQAAIWLTGDKTATIQGYVDGGWLKAGDGQEVTISYDDFADVTKVSVTPEPATICLLGLGLIGLIRRK